MQLVGVAAQEKAMPGLQARNQVTHFSIWPKHVGQRQLQEFIGAPWGKLLPYLAEQFRHADLARIDIIFDATAKQETMHGFRGHAGVISQPPRRQPMAEK